MFVEETSVQGKSRRKLSRIRGNHVWCAGELGKVRGTRSGEEERGKRDAEESVQAGNYVRLLTLCGPTLSISGLQ